MRHILHCEADVCAIRETPANEKEDLRPIGTEFTCTFDPDMASTAPLTFREVTYRITDHVLGRNEYHTLEWLEAVEVIKVKKIAALMRMTDEGRTIFEMVN